MLVQVKALVALALVAAAVPATYSMIAAPAAKPAEGALATSTSEPDLVLRGALARAGLAGPELAVAGLRANDIAGVLGRARSSSAVSENRLASASEVLAAARALVAELEEAVRGGERERLQDLEAARQAANTAEAAFTALLDEVFNAATQGQPAAVVEALRQVAANKRYKTLPLEFLVAERTEAEWAALKEALRHERVCTKLGEPTDPAIMQRLAAFRAEEAVAAARARLEANRSAVEGAWNTAAVLPQ